MTHPAAPSWPASPSFGGSMAGENVGMTIFCHPENFRPSWFHARDYGILEANPFGRQAFGKGEKTGRVQPGEKMRFVTAS